MNKMMRCWLIVFAIGFLIETGVAFGEKPAELDKSSTKMANRLEKGMKRLGLSAEQQAKVRDILKQYRSANQQLLQELVAERRALRNLIQADSIDEQAIKDASHKMAPLMADLSVQRAYLFNNLRAVLTPEQFEKFKQRQAERDARIDKHFQGASN